MCSVQITKILTTNQLYQTSPQMKSISFRATKDYPKKQYRENSDYFLKPFETYYANFDVILDFLSLYNMNLKNLRFINENFVSGATLEKRSDSDLAKIKDIGIRKIIDLRAAPPKQYGSRCEKIGIEYYNIPFDDVYNLKNPDYFVHEKNQQTQITDKFVQILKHMFEIINSGDVFIGCEFGIDRTNIALVLNYLLNKEPKMMDTSDNAPLLLRWPDEHKKQVFNRNVKATKKIFRMLTEMQKKELNLGSRYEEVLKERIAKLYLRNKTGLIGRFF